MAPLNDALLRITDGTAEVDFLGPGSGWKMANPNWNPGIADLKGGGTFAIPAMAEGRTLVFGQEGTVIETIPLSVRGFNQNVAIRNIRACLKLLKQAENYWLEPWEYDNVWLEVRPGCNNALTGYSRILRGRIPELTNPFGQPFFSNLNDQAIMEDISLIIEREPFWRGVAPGSIIGPLYNLVKNPDFEIWNQAEGIIDSEPDNWTNIETLWISGTNNRQDSGVKNGNFALKIRVGGSTLTGAAKGISQVIAGTKSATTYTALAWIRSDGVGNGVGRILVNYASQLELFRSADRQGWTLAVGTFTTGTDDVVSITCEILTTAANTDGTIYIDSLMLLEGDWTTEANNGTLPWLSSSHISNHWDQPQNTQVDAGDINYVDVWGVPGDVEALVRLEFQNNTTPTDVSAPVEVFERVRIGQRRTNNVLNFNNFNDPAGVADATASGDNRVDSAALSTAFADIVTKVVTDNLRDNQGRFRVLARVWDTRPQGGPNLNVRLRYFVGVAGISEKTLDSAPALVRGDWTIVDLTENAAMIQDSKFATNLPAQIGYTIEMNRDAGTEVARFDYSIAMPTDGGYLSAKIQPAITRGNTLIIDNTNIIQIVAATLRRGGFATVFRTSQVPLSLEVYKNSLYIGCEAGELYRYQNNVGILVGEYGAGSDIPVLEIFNGLLHVAHGDDVHTTDSIGFPINTIFTAPGNILDLKTFNGELFVAVNDGTIYRWDGTTLTLSFTTGEGSTQVLEVYNNRLYAGTDTSAKIFQFNPVDSTWSLSFTPAGGDASGFRSMKVFKGRLLAGTTANGKIYAYDGDTWTEVEDLSNINTVEVLEDLNGVLYAAGSPSASLVSSGDGDTWATIYDPQAFVVNALKVYNGAIFFAENTVKDIVAITFIDVQYKVPNYEGSLFTSPHTRRHRWFFSFNRRDNINNSDDKALIGIGFVPRYLSLRGDS